MDKVDFESLVGNVTQALQKTQQMMEQEALNGFWQYFIQKDDKLYAAAKEIHVNFSGNGEQKQGKIDIPLATLVPHNSLGLDTVEVTIHTRLAMEDDKLHAEIGREDSSMRDRFSGSARKQKQGNCDIKLVFKNNGPASGVQETINMLHKTF